MTLKKELKELRNYILCISRVWQLFCSTHVFQVCLFYLLFWKTSFNSLFVFSLFFLLILFFEFNATTCMIIIYISATCSKIFSHFTVCKNKNLFLKFDCHCNKNYASRELFQELFLKICIYKEKSRAVQKRKRSSVKSVIINQISLEHLADLLYDSLSVIINQISLEHLADLLYDSFFGFLVLVLQCNCKR